MGVFAPPEYRHLLCLSAQEIVLSGSLVWPQRLAMISPGIPVTG